MWNTVDIYSSKVYNVDTIKKGVVSMKTIKIIKSAVSYIFTFFAGVYGLCLFEGESDFFMILGFVACAVVAVVTSPLTDKYVKFEGRK